MGVLITGVAGFIKSYRKCLDGFVKSKHEKLFFSSGSGSREL